MSPWRVLRLAMAFMANSTWAMQVTGISLCRGQDAFCKPFFLSRLHFTAGHHISVARRYLITLQMCYDYVTNFCTNVWIFFYLLIFLSFATLSDESGNPALTLLLSALFSGVLNALAPSWRNLRTYFSGVMPRWCLDNANDYVYGNDKMSITMRYRWIAHGIGVL
jgi:hypothetical protein